MSPTIVLITGANRGIGRGLLERYLARADHIVIAAIRNREDGRSKQLLDLPKGSGSRLIIVNIDATRDADAPAAVEELKTQGIDHLDIVIANAGVMYAASKVSEVKISDIEGHMIPNCYGVIRLYQAMLPLLLRSEKPKWVTIGAAIASIGCLGMVNIYFRNQFAVPNAQYATSKISSHWLTKKMNGEEEKLTAFVVHPGWVATDMGNLGVTLYNAGDMTPPVTVDDCATGTMQVVDDASKETHGGRFWDYEGKEEIW